MTCFDSLRSLAIEKQANEDRPKEIKVVGPMWYWLSPNSMLFTKIAARLRYIRFSLDGRKTVQNELFDDVIRATSERFGGTYVPAESSDRGSPCRGLPMEIHYTLTMLGPDRGCCPTRS